MARNSVPRLGITVTQEMFEALEAEASRNFGTPVAALVRQAIREWLEARGYKLEEDISRGGYRRTDDDEGQRVGIRVARAA